MIYVFGNSHANTFVGAPPGATGVWNSDGRFSSYSLGPVIAYNFKNNHYPRVLERLGEIEVGNNDYVLLAVGEVDHRWHIPRVASITKDPIENLTVECVDRFFEALADLKEKNYNVIAWGSHPSTTAGHSDNPEAPIFGSCLTRNLVGSVWNRRLRELCSQFDIPFVSIFDDLVDENSLTKMEYYMDYCHLDPDKIRGMLESKFEKFFDKA